MQSISSVLESFSQGQKIRGSTAWACWRDSTRAEIRWTPLPRLDASRRWHALRAYDRSAHEKGKHGGRIGRIATIVYQCLAMDYINHTTGRLDPSLDAIASRAAVSRRSVATALRRLKDLGIVAWQRRCDLVEGASGRWELRQRTNAYSLPRVKDWLIRWPDPEPPPPDRVALGLAPEMPDELAAAAAATAAGEPGEALQHLGDAPAGSLAAALARLGQAVYGSANPASNPDREGLNEPPDGGRSMQGRSRPPEG